MTFTVTMATPLKSATTSYFNLVPNTVLVSTVPNLLTVLAANPTLEALRPHAAGDANTEVVCSRYIIPIPFKYVNIFLASGITPRRFFMEVYPLMVTDQIEQDCQSLIRSRRALIFLMTSRVAMSASLVFVVLSR